MEKLHPLPLVLLLLLGTLSSFPSSAAQSQTTSLSSFNVPQLIGEIRASAEQKATQVQSNRKSLSLAKATSVTEAVRLVTEYQQSIMQMKNVFLKSSIQASVDCRESLPKPLSSIIAMADWDIEMCIGHMAVVGEMAMDEGERHLESFAGVANQFPISAATEFFLLDWSSGSGMEEMREALTQKMQVWDNISAVELFEERKRLEEEFQRMRENDWPLCVNYGIIDMQKLFDEAQRHFENCEKEAEA